MQSKSPGKFSILIEKSSLSVISIIPIRHATADICTFAGNGFFRKTVSINGVITTASAHRKPAFDRVVCLTPKVAPL